ncbi:MAG TPA: glucoamylase family protein, partial [Rhodothermales bacterium]|nr:glucoamylase family protein [Rhodothermales bacterium]
LSHTQFIRFVNGEEATDPRTLWVDYVVGIDRGAVVTGPPPPTFTVQPGDSSVVLRWDAVPGAVATHVYRQVVPEVPIETVFEKLTDVPTTVPNFADLNVANGQIYTYILRSVDADGVQGPDSEIITTMPQAALPDAFLDLLQETAFAYFWEEANPNNGLIRDRSRPTSASSIAAVGFGLSAITVAIDKGWITREQGRDRVLTTLRYFATCPQDAATSGSCGFRGFFYHFLNMETGLRAGNSELSTIDTALLLGGILDVGAYFDGEEQDEGRIRSLAQTIYERVEWDWASPRAPLVSHGWRPGSGFLGNDWNGYNEAMILYILALGSPTFPMPPASWDAWTSGYNNQWGIFYGYAYLSFPPLFGHQYSHVWIDFRDIQDAYMRTRGIDYFENSRRATLANRAYAIANPNRYPNYGPNEWGLTASDDPFGYRAHGAPPPQSDNGTITPTAAGGSYAFTPEESTIAMRTFYRRYRTELWGEYGFRDAYNIREDWFATDVLGIDQGPILLMIENGRTEAIWERFMQIEAIQRGLEQAGFEGIGLAAKEGAEIPSEPVLLGSYPNPFSEHTAIQFTLPQPADVTLTVYDVLGRTVATVVDKHLPAGEHTTSVDGAEWASGVYFYTLQMGGVLDSGSLLRVR